MKFKIKFNLKFNLKKILTAVVVALVAGLVAFAIYGYYQFTDLRNDHNSLKGTLSDNGSLDASQLSSDEEDSNVGAVEYEVLSHETKTLRVATYEGMDSSETYESKPVLVVRMKVTNKTDSVFDSTWNISARTSKGALVTTTSLHPEDEKDSTYPSLIPNGSFEGNYYFAVEDGQDFIGLYDTYENRQIDF